MNTGIGHNGGRGDSDDNIIVANTETKASTTCEGTKIGDYWGQDVPLRTPGAPATTNLTKTCIALIKLD